jgi:hypothetical protein
MHLWLNTVLTTVVIMTVIEILIIVADIILSLQYCLMLIFGCVLTIENGDFIEFVENIPAYLFLDVIRWCSSILHI